MLLSPCSWFALEALGPAGPLPMMVAGESHTARDGPGAEAGPEFQEPTQGVRESEQEKTPQLSLESWVQAAQLQERGRVSQTWGNSMCQGPEERAEP